MNLYCFQLASGLIIFFGILEFVVMSRSADVARPWLRSIPASNGIHEEPGSVIDLVTSVGLFNSAVVGAGSCRCSGEAFWIGAVLIMEAQAARSMMITFR
jgi:hypothetical protein